jgi:putative RecB family exonuclease
MVEYSYSKLMTYDQCALKYKYKYIDKIKMQVDSTIEALLGSCVHDALEYLYNERIKGRILKLDELLEYYLKIWQENFSDKHLIVKEGVTENEYLNKGVIFLTRYYSKHAPFDDNTLETEKKVTLPLDDKSHLIGFVDRLVFNERDDKYEIHDYKTGRLKSQEQSDMDWQLALYAMAIKEEMKDGKDIILVWHYLDHDIKIVSSRTENELVRLKKDVLELIREIESARFFPHNKSTLCNWCEFKPICHAWTKQKNLNEF